MDTEHWKKEVNAKHIKIIRREYHQNGNVFKVELEGLGYNHPKFGYIKNVAMHNFEKGNAMLRSIRGKGFKNLCQDWLLQKAEEINAKSITEPSSVNG